MSEHRIISDWPHDTLLSIVETHGTPLYVIDLERIRQNYRRLSSAFEDADIYYAAKAAKKIALINGAFMRSIPVAEIENLAKKGKAEGSLGNLLKSNQEISK